MLVLERGLKQPLQHSKGLLHVEADVGLHVNAEGLEGSRISA